ncbi:transcriptional regulator [Anaerolineaceae bacterium oral taxon 439]|nr:transcriptional regulator [Anaerolineaceae bacterium oral taxon 439]
MEIRKGTEIVNEVCDCAVVHQDIVELVRGRLLSEENYYDLADIFKVFGDSTRVRILSALDVHEMCVCDLANVLSMTKSAVSHQLRILRTNNLVSARRDGKNMFYSLADDHIQSIFELALEHLNEDR